jgi:type III restriction enzyme
VEIASYILRDEGYPPTTVIRRLVMSNPFFDHPILNSPYDIPKRHWELDKQGQPTQKIIEQRRRADFITPIPKPKKCKGEPAQQSLGFGEGQNEVAANINQVRALVDAWRRLPNPNQWQVTPETGRLLQHWRHHRFSGIRPFFCQVEAIETAIWITEVAPQSQSGKRLLERLESVSSDANRGLLRLALKLATGAGKTTVMAMIIAWQSVNADRHRESKHFTRGFLVCVCTPGLTIKEKCDGSIRRGNTE